MKLRSIFFSVIFLTNQLYPASLSTLLENLKQDLTTLHKQLLELSDDEEAMLRLGEETRKKGEFRRAPLFYTKLFSLPEDLDHVTPHIESSIWAKRRPPINLQFIVFKSVHDTFFKFAEMVIIGQSSREAMDMLEHIVQVKPDAIVVLYVVSKEEAERADKRVAEINAERRSELLLFTFIIEREEVPEDIEPPYVLSSTQVEYNQAQLEKLVKRLGARSMSL